MGRRKGSYALRAGYTLLLLVVVSLAFAASQSEGAYRGGGVARLQALQSLAPQMLQVVAMFQFIAIGFLSPLLTAPAICDERRGGTLPALMTTPLSSLHIVLGKLTSRLLQAVILLLISTPLLLAIRVFGGLDAQTILSVLVVTITTAALGAALGLLCSAYQKRAAPAAVFALFSLLMIQLGPVLIEEIVRVSVSRPAPPFFTFWSCSPAIVALLTEPRAAAAAAAFAAIAPLWLLCSIYNAFWTLLVLLLSTAILRRLMRDQTAGSIAAPAAASVTPPGTGAAVGAAPDPPRGRREVGGNPVLWRELRQPWLRSRWGRLGLLGVVAVSLGWLYYELGISDPDMHAVIGVVATLAILVGAAVAATGAISSEREARTLDALLTTRLTPADIVAGKIAGALRRQWFIPLLLLVHFTFAVGAGAMHPSVLLHLALILSGPIVFLTCAGLLLSLLTRRTTLASILSVGLAVALWFGAPMGLLTLENSMGYGRRGDISVLADPVIAINPVVMAVSTAEGNAAERHPPLATAFSIGWSATDRAHFTAAMFAVWFVYLAAAAIVVINSIRFFRRAGRTS